MDQHGRMGLAAAVVAAAAGTAQGQCAELDLHGCGCLDVTQLAVLLGQWGGPGTADFDGSGEVDGVDLAYMLGHFDIYFETGCLAQPVEGMGELVIEEVTDGDDAAAGLKKFDVFVPFEEPGSVLLSVHSANVGCESPPCFESGLFAETALLIGSEPAFGLDPNSSEAAFEAGVGLGEDAGWYSIPEGKSSVGLAGQYENNEVQIARFEVPENKALEGELRVTWRTSEWALRDDQFSLSLNQPGCTADFNGDGALNVLDFIAFQGAFAAGDAEADCDGDGELTIADFVCFQGGGRWGRGARGRACSARIRAWCVRVIRDWGEG